MQQTAKADSTSLTAATDVNTEAITSVSSSAIIASFTRDWSKVSDKDRIRAVIAMCKVLNISPALNPFYFIDLPEKGKTTARTILYPGSESAALIAKGNNISLQITNKWLDKESNIYFVEGFGIDGAGRKIENIAAVHLSDYNGVLTGQQRANAMMKAVTKFQRRTVLSMVGLSIPDDDEIERLRDAQVITTTRPDNILEQRTNRILADTQLQQEDAEEFLKKQTPSEAPKPSNFHVASEAAEAKRHIFKRLLSGAIAPFNNPIEASAWVEATIGIKFDDLTAEDCQNLDVLIEEEFYTPANDVKGE